MLAPVRILVAITGASGAIYTQRLLDRLDPTAHEIHVITSNYAQIVLKEELPDGLRLAEGVQLHAAKSMNVPFASGSNAFDAMVILPCTMGTLGRIAHGVSDDALLRAADVMLKENKILILCPRETPLSLVHIKNMELLLLAGATMSLIMCAFNWFLFYIVLPVTWLVLAASIGTFPYRRILTRGPYLRWTTIWGALLVGGVTASLTFSESVMAGIGALVTGAAVGALAGYVCGRLFLSSVKPQSHLAEHTADVF